MLSRLVNTLTLSRGLWKTQSSTTTILLNKVCGIHSRIKEIEPSEKLRKCNTWLSKNDEVFTPLAPGEERRPAWICHCRTDIKYSPKKMWYIAAMIRGMTIDEALKQLSFVTKKGAHIVKEVLLEAQQLAVERENVEYKSNLWIGESFVGRGEYIKGLRRHARARFGHVEYKYCHYFVRLVEGSPPENYYPKPPTGNEKLKEYLEEWRKRRIILSL